MHGEHTAVVYTHQRGIANLVQTHAFYWSSKVLSRETDSRFIMELTAQGTSTTLVLIPAGDRRRTSTFHWSPANERSKVYDLVFVGLQSGDVIVADNQGIPSSSPAMGYQDNAFARWVIDSPQFCDPDTCGTANYRDKM